MPVSLVTKPPISSPGKGVQHFANLIRVLFIPSITIPKSFFPSFLFYFDTLLFLKLP